MYAAAKAAKAQLDAAKPKEKPPVEDDDDYDRYEPERRARVAAQGGSRRSAPAPDENADVLGPEALEICRQMGVKPEDYAASQKDLGRRRRK
jgi:hypothetical protein